MGPARGAGAAGRVSGRFAASTAAARNGERAGAVSGAASAGVASSSLTIRAFIGSGVPFRGTRRALTRHRPPGGPTGPGWRASPAGNRPRASRGAGRGASRRLPAAGEPHWHADSCRRDLAGAPSRHAPQAGVFRQTNAGCRPPLPIGWGRAEARLPLAGRLALLPGGQRCAWCVPPKPQTSREQ